MSNTSIIKQLLITVLALLTITNSAPTLPIHKIPLFGNASLGYYYANLYIGNPLQQQSVIVDTGSGILALPCSKCNKCGKHLNVPFKVNDSTTAEILKCNSTEAMCSKTCSKKSASISCAFGISYAEGSSLKGIVLKDTIRFENKSNDEGIITSFGCTTQETNLFVTQAANGIFGLAHKRDTDFLEKMIKQHTYNTKETLQFSLCLARNGGLMTVGKTDHSLHTKSEDKVTTTYSTGKNLYILKNIGKITLGQEIIRSNQKLGSYSSLFIDSGATFTYLPPTIYNKFMSNMNSICKNNKEECIFARGESTPCFKVQSKDPNQPLLSAVKRIFPPLNIDINGKTVAWGSEKYLLLRNKQNKEVCLGVDRLDRFILGANWMVDRDIVFQLHTTQVHIFSNANCSNYQHDFGHYTLQPPTSKLDYYFPSTFRQNVDKILVFLVVLGSVVFLVYFFVMLCQKKIPFLNHLDHEEKQLEQNGEDEMESQRRNIGSQYQARQSKRFEQEELEEEKDVHIQGKRGSNEKISDQAEAVQQHVDQPESEFPQEIQLQSQQIEIQTPEKPHEGQLVEQTIEDTPQQNN